MPAKTSSMQGVKVCSVVLNSFVNDFRVLKTARSLRKAGYQIEVVALHEGQPDLKEREVVHGIPVYRVKLRTKNWWRISVVQYFKYLEFIFKACRESRRADIYHCNDLSALPVGVFCKWLSGGQARVIYDAHEYESERSGYSSLMRRVTRYIERWLIRYADSVITVSPSIASEYVRLYGIEMPHLIYNAPYYFEKRDMNLLRERLGIREDQRIFLFQGGMSRGRGIEVLLEAFADLDSGYCLVLIGGGSLVNLVKEYVDYRSNIFYIPTVDPMSLWELTCSADYGVHLIENTCLNHYLCLPNKLFEYMMAELPVVVSNMLELERFVKTNNVGVLSEVSRDALKRKVMEIAAEDREKYIDSIRAVKSQFTWEEQERTLLLIYSQISRLRAPA